MPGDRSRGGLSRLGWWRLRPTFWRFRGLLEAAILLFREGRDAEAEAALEQASRLYAAHRGMFLGEHVARGTALLLALQLRASMKLQKPSLDRHREMVEEVFAEAARKRPEAPLDELLGAVVFEMTRRMQAEPPPMGELLRAMGMTQYLVGELRKRMLDGR